MSERRQVPFLRRQILNGIALQAIWDMNKYASFVVIIWAKNRIHLRRDIFTIILFYISCSFAYAQPTMIETYIVGARSEYIHTRGFYIVLTPPFQIQCHSSSTLVNSRYLKEMFSYIILNTNHAIRLPHHIAYSGSRSFPDRL